MYLGTPSCGRLRLVLTQNSALKWKFELLLRSPKAQGRRDERSELLIKKGEVGAMQLTQGRFGVKLCFEQGKRD